MCINSISQITTALIEIMDPPLLEALFRKHPLKCLLMSWNECNEWKLTWCCYSWDMVESRGYRLIIWHTLSPPLLVREHAKWGESSSYLDNNKHGENGENGTKRHLSDVWFWNCATFMHTNMKQKQIIIDLLLGMFRFWIRQPSENKGTKIRE